MLRTALLPVALAAVFLSYGEATACRLASPSHRDGVDTANTANLPAPAMTGVQIERGSGDRGGEGDCADLGFLTIDLAPMAGVDLSAHGLLVEVQSGELPVLLDETSSWKIEGSHARLIMSDGYGQPPFTATVTLRLVNGDGEVGAASEAIVIADGGAAAEAEGCTCAGRTSAGAWSIVLALGLGFVGRRRW